MKLALTSLYYVSWEIWLGNTKNLFAYTNQDSKFFLTRENSKMINITSKYFSFFNNKPPASRVASITECLCSLILGPRPPFRQPSVPDYCKTTCNTTI